MSRNPIAKSLASPHLKPKVVPDKKRGNFYESLTEALNDAFADSSDCSGSDSGGCDSGGSGD